MITIPKTPQPISKVGDYLVEEIDHRPFSKRIDAARIDGVKLPDRPWEKQSRGWRASGLAHCLKQQAYAMLGHTPSVDTYNPDYERAAGQGTWLHENVQKHMIACGDLVYAHPVYGPGVELRLDRCCDPAMEPLRRSLSFTGHIDAVVKTPVGGGRATGLAVWDLKTVSSADMLPTNRWFEQKLLKWAIQVNSYAHFFMTPNGTKCQESYILAMSRDKTSDRRLFRVPYQPDLADAEMARVAAAQALVAAGTLPVGESGACRFCGFGGCSERR